MRVLIVKTGYSETLDPEVDKQVSLGDVLRTTVILHLFKDDDVTWLTDERALTLLDGNPCIDRLMAYDLSSILQLQAEQFDAVVNLEKVPGLAAFSDRLQAWRKYGFRYDPYQRRIEGYTESQEALAIIGEKNACGEANNGPWQSHLFKMLGRVWQGEEYVFGSPPQPASGPIGLNVHVGSKWPQKAWGEDKFRELGFRLQNGLKVDWQKGTQNLQAYIKWVAGCSSLVTNDSLGLHLAIAMKIPVIAIFMMSNPHEVHLYGRGEKLVRPTVDEVASAVRHLYA